MQMQTASNEPPTEETHIKDDTIPDIENEEPTPKFQISSLLLLIVITSFSILVFQISFFWTALLSSIQLCGRGIKNLIKFYNLMDAQYKQLKEKMAGIGFFVFLLEWLDTFKGQWFRLKNSLVDILFAGVAMSLVLMMVVFRFSVNILVTLFRRKTQPKEDFAEKMDKFSSGLYRKEKRKRYEGKYDTFPLRRSSYKKDRFSSNTSNTMQNPYLYQYQEE